MGLGERFVIHEGNTAAELLPGGAVEANRVFTMVRPFGAEYVVDFILCQSAVNAALVLESGPHQLEALIRGLDRAAVEAWGDDWQSPLIQQSENDDVAKKNEQRDRGAVMLARYILANGNASKEAKRLADELIQAFGENSLVNEAKSHSPGSGPMSTQASRLAEIREKVAAKKSS